MCRCGLKSSKRIWKYSSTMLFLVYLSSLKMYARRHRVTVHFDQESQYLSEGKIFSWVATAHPGSKLIFLYLKTSCCKYYTLNTVPKGS